MANEVSDATGDVIGLVKDPIGTVEDELERFNDDLDRELRNAGDEFRSLLGVPNPEDLADALAPSADELAIQREANALRRRELENARIDAARERALAFRERDNRRRGLFSLVSGGLRGFRPTGSTTLGGNS